MTKQDLLNFGFEIIQEDQYYWFELKYKNHRFISNDNAFNDGKDEWHLGYEDINIYEDTFWFNGNLNEKGMFPIIFNLLTGKEFKLANQRKKKK